jgi:hypothetical protein
MLFIIRSSAICSTVETHLPGMKLQMDLPFMYSVTKELLGALLEEAILIELPDGHPSQPCQL